MRCRYAMACRGGCWLQRRHGTQCFKDVWNAPKPVKAACLAVCVGLVGAGLASPGEAAPAEPNPPAQNERQRPARTRRPGRSRAGSLPHAEFLEHFIIRWHAPFRADVLNAVRTQLPNDPAARYFLAHAEGSVPKDLAERAGLIKAALETDQRSLSLIALMWRDVTEWCLDSEGPAKRTAVERQALRELLTALHVSAHAWRMEIFEKKISPFLRRDGRPERSYMSKAGPRPHERALNRVARERWQGWIGRRRQITKEFLEQHPYAEFVILPYETKEDVGLLCVRGGGVQPADGRLQILDLLTTAPEPGREEGLKLTFKVGRSTLDVLLPRGTDLAYADVLRLTHEQNREAFKQIVDDSPRRKRRGRPERERRGRREPEEIRVMTLLGLPAMHAACRKLETEGETEGNPELRRWKERLRNLYLF